MATAKTTKTSKNTVASVNKKCEELENIVSRLEARIVELENNLNSDSSTPSSDDGWKGKLMEVIKIMLDGEYACRKIGL